MPWHKASDGDVRTEAGLGNYGIISTLFTTNRYDVSTVIAFVFETVVSLPVFDRPSAKRQVGGLEGTVRINGLSISFY